MNKSIIKKFKKNNKTYYLLQCNECKNIQETYHKEYVDRKCKKCISQKILGNKYNGSIVYEEGYDPYEAAEKYYDDWKS